MTIARVLKRSLAGVVAGSFAAGLLAAAPAVAADVVDGPEVKWRVSLWGNKRAGTQAAESAARILKERTGGKFTLTLGYGEIFSKARENLDSLKIGAIEMAFFCNFYHPGKNPGLMVLTMPFLPIGDAKVRQQVTTALYEHPVIQEEMARWNGMLWVSSLLPQYEFLGRGEAPTTLDKWKGMRVRAGGGIGDAMEVLGATKVTVPATEVYTLMERGTADAASFPYTYAHVAYKIHEVSTWFTANMSPGTSDCPFAVNRDSFAALPKQYQSLMMEIRDQIHDEQLQAYAEVDVKNLKLLNEKLTPVEYSDKQRAEFERVAGKPVWDAWVKEYADKTKSQELLDFVLAEAGKAAKTQ